MAAASRRRSDTWTASRRVHNLVTFYGIIFIVIWAWFTILDAVHDRESVRAQQLHSTSQQKSFSQSRPPLSQQVLDYAVNISPQSSHPFELSTRTCPTILWQQPQDHIPFPLVPPRRQRTASSPPDGDLFHNGRKDGDNPMISAIDQDEEWSTWTHTCKSIKSWSPLFSIHHCSSVSHCAQGYFSIKRLSNCPTEATNPTTSDYENLSPSAKHARHFWQNVGPDGFHAVFQGEGEQYAVRQKQYIGDCETILHYHMAMPGRGDWTIVHEYSDWNHINETSQMAWPPFIGETILTWSSHVCPGCTYDMMHRYTPRESLPICKKDDEKHPLRGAFIQRFSENIMGEDKPIEWVPYGCRLVNTVGVSGSSRIIETVLDDATPSFSDTNDLFNPGMEPSVVRSREEMNTVESKDDTIEERSILLIGDSQVRALMERLIQSSTSGLGQVTSKLRNEAQSNVMGPKRISYTSKTVVLDVQRKLDGGRIRVRIQHQFDPFLYHLGNLSASARAGKMFPAHNLHANPNQQHTMYTAGTAGPEVPSFLPSFQDHMFDTVLFNFGHWPASGKHLGGHWTSDDVLTHLQDVIHSLKEYERLRSQEHERRRHEEQQRRNYFGRMYGAQPDAWPYLRHTKMEQHRTFQALFLGMPATHTRADTHLQEAEDWKNNYRFAYWSSLAEELMAAHSIPTLDSFGITLLAAGGATEDNISIDQEVTDAVVAAVTHFIDV